MSKIQKTSRSARYVLQLLIILMPLSTVYFWATVGTPYDILSQTGIVELELVISQYTHQPLALWTRLWAGAESLGLIGILVYGLLLLSRLLKNYENEEIFTAENTLIYSKLGKTIFYWVIANFIYGGLLSVILSMNNPTGERMLQLSFTGSDAVALFLGVITLIISWVMKEAYKIAEENRQTI